MNRQAANAAIRINGTNITAALCSCSPAAVTTTIGTANWIAAVPILPPAALSPSAVPLLRAGKKNEMLAIDEAKLPPPKPARAVTSSSVVKEVWGFCTAQSIAVTGTSSSNAEMTVQFRPPKMGTARV